MERNRTEACTDLEKKKETEKESVYVQHKFNNYCTITSISNGNDRQFKN